MSQISLSDIVIGREQDLDVDEVISILRASTLAERRPVDDRRIVGDMIRHGNLTITARHKRRLVGLSRTLTDFSYVGYLSDLAVDAEYQKIGIGRELIRETRRHMGERSMLVLLAAPAARDYYPALGFDHMDSAWLLRASAPM